MTLRSRLALALLLCGLVPVVGAGAVARSALEARYASDDARRREAAVARVELTLEQRVASQRRLLGRFCASDYLVDRALLQLETRQFGEAARAELGAVLPEVRDALGLDVLSFVSGDATVLASAHYPGLAGTRDAETWRLANRGGSERVLRAVRVREREGPRDRLVLESACVRRRGTVALAVAGGVGFDERLFEGFARDEGVSVRLVLRSAGEADTDGGRTRVLPLRGPDGAPVAAVLVSTSDAPLRAVRSELDALTASAALVAGLLAVLLAGLLSVPLARPIAVLAEAADRIAKGERPADLGVRAGGEVGRLIAAFSRMAEGLAAADKRLRKMERLAAWRDIARQMAHEIKNPLTPIRMGVEMLRKARERALPDFDAVLMEETGVILDEVERLRRLVEDFSRFARAPRPRLGAVSLVEVVEHVVELHANGPVRVVWRAEGCEVRGLPPSRADRDQLTQVLVNLVANACWAADERATRDPTRGAGEVSVVVTRPSDEALRVTVEDNGAGIAPEVMERLFEPYVTKRPGGTGLGLAIAYRIVTDHGGTLSAESGAWGTRFVVQLPFAGPAAVASDTQRDE